MRDRGQTPNFKKLSAKIIGAILYNECSEVNRINQDYWTGLKVARCRQTERLRLSITRELR